MKVLQISNKLPYPEKDGGSLAINAITEGLLKAGCDVTLLAMNTKKHFVAVDSIPEKYRSDRHLETVSIDTSVKPLAALAALLTNTSYNLSRFQSAEFSRKLSGILQKEKFDIIQMEGIYLAGYLPVIRKHSHAPVILRTHNIEWKIWQKLAGEEKNLLKKWYLNTLSKQLKKEEEKAMNLFDGIATISKPDMAFLKDAGCKVPMITIPFGIDISKYTPKESAFTNSLFYIGALDWLPNLQGLEWFFKNVWTTVHSKFPDVQFHVAGRNMPERLTNSKHAGVVFHGEVKNATAFMQEYDIMLVPLLAGSGVRVKIMESMAMGKAIITTPVGIEGIECTFGKEALIADTAEQFIDGVCKCLANKEVKQNLGESARMFAEQNNDIRKISMELIDFYKQQIIQRQ